MNIDVLLGLLVLVGAFVVFELVGLLVPGAHTISWQAKHHRWLYRLIYALFVLGGVVGVWWWRDHIAGHLAR